MTTAETTCPHCGKTLPSPDKLGWHLSRECPALVAIATAGTSSKGDRPEAKK